MSLGGFYAGGQSQGMTQGINNYNAILNNAQNRRIQSEKWALESQRQMNQMVAQTRMMEQQFGTQDPDVQYLRQQVDELKKQQQKTLGGGIKALINRFITSSDPQREVPAMQKYHKDNPEASKLDGLKRPESLRLPDINNPQDVNKLKKMYIKMHPGVYTDEELDILVKQTYNSGLFIMADDHLINLYGLGKATGSFTYLDEEARNKLEQKAAHLLGARRETKPKEGEQAQPQQESQLVRPEAPEGTIPDEGEGLTGTVGQGAPSVNGKPIEGYANPMAAGEGSVGPGTPYESTPTEEYANPMAAGEGSVGPGTPYEATPTEAASAPQQVPTYGPGQGQPYFGEGQGPSGQPATQEPLTSQQDWYLAQAAGWTPYSTRESKLTEPKIKQQYDFIKETRGEDVANQWLDSQINTQKGQEPPRIQREAEYIGAELGPEAKKTYLESVAKINQGEAAPQIAVGAYPGVTEDLKNQKAIQDSSSTRASELSNYYKTQVVPKVHQAESWLRTRNRVLGLLSNIDYNAINNTINKAKTYVGEKVWRKFRNAIGKPVSEWNEEELDAYNRIQSVLGVSMANFIKSISGAAASDEERAFLMDVVFGGWLKDEETMKSRLDEFTNRMYQDAMVALDDPNARLWAPNQSGAYKRNLQAKIQRTRSAESAESTGPTESTRPKTIEYKGKQYEVKKPYKTPSGKVVYIDENGQWHEMKGK